MNIHVYVLDALVLFWQRQGISLSLDIGLYRVMVNGNWKHRLTTWTSVFQKKMKNIITMVGYTRVILYLTSFFVFIFFLHVCLLFFCQISVIIAF